MAEEPTKSPHKNKAELQQEFQRLSLEKHQYLDDLNNGEMLKMQLKETRRDAKHLSKQRERLQALADIAKEEDSEQVACGPQSESQASLEEDLPTAVKPLPELQPPQAFVSVSKEESLSFNSGDSFPPPPPPHGFSMNGEISPTLPASPFTNHVPRAPEWGVRDANALQIENRNLITLKRKQEEQIDKLVQEVATLETRCKELESIAQRLEAENQRLSMQLSQAHIGRVQNFSLRPHEEIALARAQLKAYEDDFKKERSDRENLQTKNERLKRELRESQATVAGLQKQLKQALAGEGGYGEPRDLPRAPLVNEPYYNTVQFGYPLDYGMARTYSGGYIGPGASNDALRRERTPYVRKAFLSPDVTAVIDRDVTDGSNKGAPKSI